MKNVVLLSVLAVNLVGAASSFAQTSTTDPSPAFGYPSYAEPGARSPATDGPDLLAQFWLPGTEHELTDDKRSD
jgi:hypothetical protein